MPLAIRVAEEARRGDVGRAIPRGRERRLASARRSAVVDRVSGRVGEVRVAADEAAAVDLGGTASEILSVLKTFAHWQRASQWGRLGGARTNLKRQT